MAKRKIEIKRVLAKSGQVYYYKSGKRISVSKGQKAYFKQLKQAPPRDLTNQEQLYFKRSQASKKARANTYTFGGKPIQRIYAVLLSRVFNNEQLLETKDLSTWINPGTGAPLFNRFSDILKTIDRAGQRSKDIFKNVSTRGNFRNEKKQTSLIDVAETFKRPEYRKYKFELIDRDGDLVEGKIDIMDTLRIFETEVLDEIVSVSPEKVVKASFNYFLDYDFVRRIITLDIQDQFPDITIADIFERKPNTDSLKIDKKNKFKDVEINFITSK